MYRLVALFAERYEVVPRFHSDKLVAFVVDVQVLRDPASLAAATIAGQDALSPCPPRLRPQVV